MSADTEAMAQVLAHLMARPLPAAGGPGVRGPAGDVEGRPGGGRAGDPRGAARAVSAVVDGYGQVREAVGSWDGLVHRRVRVSRGHLDALSVERTVRGDWELLRVRHPLDGGSAGFVVDHWFARWLGTSRSASAQPGGGRRGAARGLASATAPGTVPVRVTRGDVARWARASGDSNAIHRLPGRAREAGLSGAGEGVVAHGVLGAALSLALAPADAGEWECHFLAPVVVGEDRPALLYVDAAGTVSESGQVVCRRTR